MNHTSENGHDPISALQAEVDEIIQRPWSPENQAEFDEAVDRWLATVRRTSTPPQIHDSKDTHTFDTGAKRSTFPYRYDLISPVGMARLATTCDEGAKKYGEHNWEKGIPVSNLVNHVIGHLYRYLAGDTSEDHLAHAAWGCFAAMHMEETRPDMMDVPTRHVRMVRRDPTDQPPTLEDVAWGNNQGRGF